MAQDGEDGGSLITELVASVEARTAAGTDTGDFSLWLRQDDLFKQIDAHPLRAELIRALLNHANPSVRFSTAWRCGPQVYMTEEAEKTMLGLVAEKYDGAWEVPVWQGNLKRWA